MPAAPSGQNAAQKRCIVCGEDVSNKPRVKDAQGRYVCAGECQQKLAAKAAAQRSGPPPVVASPKAPPAPADDVMSKIIGASPMINAQNCPECAAPMTAGSVVCVRCGHNTQTGKALRTQVVKVKEPPMPKAARGSRARSRYASDNGPPFWKFLLIYCAALSCLSLLVFAGPAGVMIGFLLLILANLVAVIACIIAAFKNDQTVFGILGLTCFVPFVNIIGGIGLLVFNLFFNEDSASKAMYWATIVASIVFGVVLGIAAVMGMNVNLGSTTLNPLG